MSIANVIKTQSNNNAIIAEKLPKVYHAGQLNVLANAESLNGSLSGKGVSANDVIDIEHNIGCNISSKNLCNIFGYSAQLITTIDTARALSNSYGTTISTIDTSDTIEVTQSNYSDDVSYEGHYSNGAFYVGFDTSIIPVGSTVTLSFDLEVTNNLGNKSRIFISENGNSAVLSKNSVYFVNGRNSLTFTDWRDLYSNPNVGFEIRLNGISGIFSNFQVEIGSTATEYTPYITDFSQVEVSRYGKNLYDISKGLYKDILVDNGDGSYTLTKTNNGVQSKLVSCFIPANTDITLSVDVIEYTGTYWTPFPVHFFYDDGTSLAYWLISVNNWDSTKIRTFKTDKNIIGFQLRHPPANDLGAYTKFKDFQIELGTTGTTYEPFKGIETYQSTADGVVDGTTSIAPSMTLLTNAEGVIINANYYKDPDIVISNIAQSVALSGGEG